MVRSGHVKRLELENPSLIKSKVEVRKKFPDTGWLDCIRRFYGHNIEVSSQFILSFKDDVVKVRGLRFLVTEAIISEAMGIPCTRDRWFKNAAFSYIDLNVFIKPEHQNPPWSTGFPQGFLLDKWNTVERFVRQYFTYEGRYVEVHMHHMRFLVHMAGLKPMNLPFFLHKSLVKMVTKAKQPDDINTRFVFHQGLIKILYDHAVKSRQEAIPRLRCRSRRGDRPIEVFRE